MRIQDAPLDTWLSVPDLGYAVRRRRFGTDEWLELWNGHISVYCKGPTTWEDHDGWAEVL